MHVVMVACYHPLHAAPCFYALWHINPNILPHFTENVFNPVSLVFTVCSNTCITIRLSYRLLPRYIASTELPVTPTILSVLY